MAKIEELSPEEKRAAVIKKQFQKELDTPCGECGKLLVLAQLAQELDIDKAALWRFVNTHVVLLEPSLVKIERWVKARQEKRG